MLTIPSGNDLKVDANEKEENRLLECSRAWLEKEERSDGIHVSDLLDPMYAWHQKKAKDKDRRLLDREVTTFLVGKVLHAFIISAMDGKKGTDWASDEGSKHNSKLGLEYSIDYIDKVPTEIKTSRSFYEPKSIKDLSMYLEQELCYMVAEKSLQGKLWILYLNIKDEQGRTAPAYRAYDITVSKEALDEYENQMLEIRTKLIAALKKSKPSGLPLCRTWKCGIKMCKYWSTCKPEGRFNKPEKEWKLKN